MQRLNVMPMAESLFFLGRWGEQFHKGYFTQASEKKVDANNSGLSPNAHSGRGTWKGCRAQEDAGPHEQRPARLPAEVYRVLSLPGRAPHPLTESSPSRGESPRTNAEKVSKL